MLSQWRVTDNQASDSYPLRMPGARHLRSALSLGFALAMAVGCGDNGLPPASSVIVTISPSTATIPAKGSVALVGSGSGFAAQHEVAAPVILWGIQESSNTVPVSGCSLLPSQTPDLSLCPYGYVVQSDVITMPSAAVYHAPATPGTNHVVFTATQSVEYSNLQKSATATITVTP